MFKQRIASLILTRVKDIWYLQIGKAKCLLRFDIIICIGLDPLRHAVKLALQMKINCAQLFSLSRYYSQI